MSRDPSGRFAFDPQDPPAHITRWMTRFQKLLDSQPADVWVYVASGSPLVMAKGPDGERVFDDRTFSDDAVVGGLVCPGEWDGGDF